MTLPTKEIEEAVIGAAIVDPTTLDITADIVSPADFADRDLGQVFELMIDMHTGGEPVSDPLVIASRLKATGLMARLGGPAGVRDIGLRWCDSPRNAKAYAERIRAAAGLRRLQQVAAELAERAADGNASPAEIAAWVDAQLCQHLSGATTGSVSLASAAKSALRDISAGPNAKGVRGLPTGLRGIDAVIGGLYGGDLCILAARPSIGKSALATQVAIHSAELDNRVLFVTLEMSPNDIALRQLAARLRYEVRVLRAGRVDADDIAEGERYVREIESLPMHLWAHRSATVAKIRAAARIQKATTGLELMVIDYLGLVAPADPRKPRWESISEASGALKSLAQELAIPVLCLCQLGRDAEGKVPRLDHLRDAGAIEQDADLVMLLHRESRDATDAVLDIAKARNGATGLIDLKFDPASVSFADTDCPRDTYEDFA